MEAKNAPARQTCSLSQIAGYGYNSHIVLNFQALIFAIPLLMLRLCFIFAPDCKLFVTDPMSEKRGGGKEVKQRKGLY